MAVAKNLSFQKMPMKNLIRFQFFRFNVHETNVITMLPFSKQTVPFCIKAHLVADRLIGDFDKCAPAMRKALNYKDGVALHQAAGSFLHFLAMLERQLPPSFFSETRDSLTKQFHLGFLDSDLQHQILTQVPPGDPRSIHAFRTGQFDMIGIDWASFVSIFSVLLGSHLAASPFQYFREAFHGRTGQDSAKPERSEGS